MTSAARLLFVCALFWFCKTGFAQGILAKVTNPPPDAFTVSEAALHTITLPDRSIPEIYWGPAIRALKPIRVYRDLMNVAVVTSRDLHEERGIYYYVSISSYRPMDGAGRKFFWNEKAGYLEYAFSK